jgi:diphthamide biosynthesis protein 2|mmetsp:Transcript_14688/g.2416  ORF Transcript_14688/g.2416 Transcript_14688/m.2416 type:complete len:109 (+) Transcript_14688:618-944(+)
MYNKIEARLIQILRSAGKIFYPIHVGKINLLKLGNFAEIDMFVYVGCPFTQLPNNRDYMVPLITPFELECGFQDEWSGEYTTDYTTLLQNDLPEILKDENEQETYDKF